MSSDWSLQQLGYLREVVRSTTWTEAAERLGVSQPALSQGLAQLERHLGVDLFERRGRHRVLTDAAAPLMELAERVLVAADDLSAVAARLSRGDLGPLRVGMIDVAALHTSPEAITTFRHRHPEVELRLMVAPSSRLLASLMAGALDLAVVVRPEELPAGVDSSSLVDEALRVYAPAATAGDLPAAEWGPWAMYPDGSTTRSIIERALRRAGAPTDAVSESDNPEVLRQMVRLGLGWAVLPASEADAGAHPLQAFRPEPVARRSLVITRRADAPVDPRAEEFIALCRV